MQSQDNFKIFLYLARRDKRGIRVLAIFNGKSVACRVDDLKAIGLEGANLKSIENIVYENRMYWELWAENAKDYTDLTSKLNKRGFTNIPYSTSIQFDLTKGMKFNTSNLPELKTMLRKKMN